MEVPAPVAVVPYSLAVAAPLSDWSSPYVGRISRVWVLIIYLKVFGLGKFPLLRVHDSLDF